MPSPATAVFKNVCPLDCPDTCSMLVTVRDGVAVELKGDPDHPFTRGFLCQKMARYLDRVYSPDRLMHPMKRVGPKGEGRFERISLGRGARPTIAARFDAIAESTDGPQAILPYSYYGTMGKLQAEQPRPPVLPPARRLEARPHDLRLGRRRRLRVHDRPRPPGRRPDGRARLPVHRQLGLEHGQHQQPPLEPDDRGPQAERRDDRHHRPLREPHRPTIRLAHPAPPRHRRRPGARPDARDLARRPGQTTTTWPRRPSAPTCSATAC